MAQFDVYKNKEPKSRGRTPFLLDLQSDVLSVLTTRIVVPLRRFEKGKSAAVARLHPIIGIGGTDYIAVVSESAAVPSSILGEPAGTARDYRKSLIEACDLVFTGF
jgi:toxin CcdB